jgi:hypothetical protein
MPWEEPVDLDPGRGNLAGVVRASVAPVDAGHARGQIGAVKAPVHSFTCAGTHMLYALLTALHTGYAGQDRRERTQRQINLLVWRLTADVALIERFYKERAAENGVYWFESGRQGQDPRTRRGVPGLRRATWSRHAHAGAAGAAEGGDSHAQATARGYGGAKHEGCPGREPELFRQLVGDACHARHGLTLT